MRLIILFTFTIFLLGDCFAQKTLQSKLYSNKGRLIVDPSLKITLRQLNKWITIEDTLTKMILKQLIYPPELYENGIYYKLIISFTVDNKGTFNDFKIENYDSIIAFQYDNKTNFRYSKMFSEVCYNSIIFCSRNFEKQGFKTSKNKYEKYYLPISFNLSHYNTLLFIKNGWMTYEKKIFPIYNE